MAAPRPPGRGHFGEEAPRACGGLLPTPPAPRARPAGAEIGMGSPAPSLKLTVPVNASRAPAVAVQRGEVAAGRRAGGRWAARASPGAASRERVQQGPRGNGRTASPRARQPLQGRPLSVKAGRMRRAWGCGSEFLPALSCLQDEIRCSKK